MLSENEGLWTLAYILTLEGRSDFQKRVIKLEKPHIKGSLKHFKFIKENNDENIEDTNGEVIIPENEEVMMIFDGREYHLNEDDFLLYPETENLNDDEEDPNDEITE